MAAPRAFRSFCSANGRFQEAAPSFFLTTQKAAERGSCFAGLRPGAQAEGKTLETANGRKAACLKSYRALQLKPVRIWIFDGIGNRLIPARDFFLEKKQKRARCSGLPSRFILCRTCRAKAACLGGVSVCIPYAAGAAYASRTVRHARTRLWPCACAHGGGSSMGRDDAKRAANAVA